MRRPRRPLRLRPHRAREGFQAQPARVIQAQGLVFVGVLQLSLFSLPSPLNLTTPRSLPPVPEKVDIGEVKYKDPRLMGKTFKKDQAKLKEYLEELGREDTATALAIGAKLEAEGKATVGPVECLDGRTFEVTSEMISISKKTITVYERKFLPSVIEPSFGIGRIMNAAFQVGRIAARGGDGGGGGHGGKWYRIASHRIASHRMGASQGNGATASTHGKILIKQPHPTTAQLLRPQGRRRGRGCQGRRRQEEEEEEGKEEGKEGRAQAVRPLLSSRDRAVPGLRSPPLQERRLRRGRQRDRVLSPRHRREHEGEKGGDTIQARRCHTCVLPFSPFSTSTSSPHPHPSHPPQVDMSGSSIGKRYARFDELGVPFAITVDFDTAALKSATVRERDSKRRVRVPMSRMAATICALCEGTLTFGALISELGEVGKLLEEWWGG